MPKVSIIMGTYNGSKTIERSINSVLNQTFEDFEFIICDDASNDKNIEILEKIASKDKRIKILKNKKNLKLAETLNRCLMEASGEYIARMDDDDICHQNRLEKQVQFLDKNLDYAIVGTSRNLYDNDGIWGKDTLTGERNKVDIYLGANFVHPSVMMRKEAVFDVGLYTSSSLTARTEDYDLWCKFYSKGYKGYNLEAVLLDYYQSKTSYKKRKYIYRISEYKQKKFWRKKLNLSKKYDIYAYKPIIAGLIPTRLLVKYHKLKFKK